MIKGDYDYLNNLAKFNVCSEHKTPLEIAWYGQEKTWVLHCGHDHYPDVVTRQLSLTQEYKAGEELPSFIEDKVKKGMRKRAMQEDKETKDARGWLVPKVDLATGELLLPEKVQALVDYAYKYKLDPYRSHVVMMYGKPYITMDGYLYHAFRSGIPYTLQSRPLTGLERTDYQIPMGAYAWLSTVIFTDTGQEFTGTGIVTEEELTEESKGKPGQKRYPVVAAHPWQLAQKRAEWQAMRRAFPIGESEEIKEEA